MAWRLLRLEPLGLQEGPASPPEPGAFRPLEEPWEAKRGGQAPWPEPLYFVDGRERAEALVAQGPRLALLGCVAAGAVALKGGRVEVLGLRVRRVGVGLEEADINNKGNMKNALDCSFFVFTWADLCQILPTYG